MARNFFKTLLTLMLLAGVSASAQVDTDFWFAVPKLAHTHHHEPIVLVVSNTEQQQATVTVTKAYSNQQVGTLDVPANGSATLTLVSNEAGLANFECEYNSYSPNGLYIHSDRKVNAYVALQDNNSEIYALKGESGLGTRFFVPMQFQYTTGNGNQSDSYYGTCRNAVEIIGTENNTTVTITPSQTCGSGNNQHPAGSTFTITLQRGQVYCLASNSQAATGHLFGTIITSDKPIVVDASDDSVTPNNSNYDLVADQLVPEDLAGNQYVVVPSPSTASNYTGSVTNPNLSDYAFIFALEDSTDVTVYYETTNGNWSQTQYTNLMRGDKRAFHFTYNKPAFVYSYHEYENEDGDTWSEPRDVFVFQLTGAGNELGGTQLPHVYCTGSTKVTYRPLSPTQSGATKHLFLTLVCKAETEDGQSVVEGFQIQTNSGSITIGATEWHVVPGNPSMRYCQKDITSINNSQFIQVSNSVDKFHMGMIDYHQTLSGYADCSISYFSNYTSGSSIKFASDITYNDYCQGDTIIFGFDSVDASIWRISGPEFEINNESQTITLFQRMNVMPDHSGTYIVTAKDSRNCLREDLTDTIEITVHPTVDTVLYDTICPGVGYVLHVNDEDSINIPAENTLEIGILRDTVTLQTTGLGCDSLVILQLTIRDSVVTRTVYDEVCFGKPYSGFDDLFSFPADSAMEVRTFSDTAHIPAEAGSAACDSLVILYLTVRDSVRNEFDMHACNQYTWEGITYTKSCDTTRTLVGEFGCDSVVTMHLEIEVPTVEIVTTGEDFCEFGELILTAISGYDDDDGVVYNWNDGTTGSNYVVTLPGTYTVTATSADGCEAKASYNVPNCEFHIYMPNSITPTRPDGLNDYLYLPSYVHRFLTFFEIEIYDRWGGMIYKSDDMNFQWGGEGAHVSDVYIWVVTVKNLEGKQFTFKGTVTVL